MHIEVQRWGEQSSIRRVARGERIADRDVKDATIIARQAPTAQTRIRAVVTDRHQTTRQAIKVEQHLFITDGEEAERFSRMGNRVSGRVSGRGLMPSAGERRGHRRMTMSGATPGESHGAQQRKQSDSHGWDLG